MNTLRNITLGTLLVGTLSWAESIGPFDRSLASETDYVHAVTPSIGFDRGQLVISGDYELKVTEHFGFGGALYFTPEDEPNYAQIFGIGVDAKIHAPLGDIDLYARPGFGVALVEYEVAGSSKNTTMLSPFFGVGAIYRVAANIGVGAEYLTSFNWTEDELPGSKGNFLVATQIRF